MGRANVFVYDECIDRDISFPKLPSLLSEHYGQYAEDLIIASLLLAWSRRTGATLSSLRYLEIGSNHPIAASATFLLNRKLGMRGVIVEANPALIECLRRVRTDDVIVSGAVQTQDVSTANFSASDHGGLVSLDRSFASAWQTGAVGESSVISVPGLSINQVIETHFPEDPPAYLSIDIEGMHLPVLRDLDFVRFRPLIVQAEASDEYIPENSLCIKEFMALRGYLLIAQTEVNLIFMAMECLDFGRHKNMGATNEGVAGVLQDGDPLAAKSQLQKARAEISQLHQRQAAIASELAAKEALLRLLHQSRSWRVTAPLRVLARTLKLNSNPEALAAPAVPNKPLAPKPSAVPGEALLGAANSVIDQAVVSHKAPSTAVSVLQNFSSLEEFTAFANATPLLFDDEVEKLIIRHCQTHGIQSAAMGFCDPSEVAITGAESRENLMVRGLNSRQRAVVEELYAFLECRNLSPDTAKIYGHEAITPLALFLRGRFPKYLGTEFASNEIQKAELFPILHGDVCHSDFKSSTFDVIVSCDVFEHVPSVDEALAESARILVDGGRLIGTFPFFYCRQNSIQFATIENGELKHLIDTPICHGNRMDPDGGSLVFEIFGWDLLARARRAGFAHAAMRFVCDQKKGIVATSLGEQLRAKGIFVAIFDK